MSARGFTLGELLGAKTKSCLVRGCTRTWSDLSSAKALPGARDAAADPATAGMCEPCRTKFVALSEDPRPCARPGCAGTWAWPRQDQLEAWVQKRQPPKRLCTACEAELAGLSEKDVPCSAPGCTRHAKVSPQTQLMGAATPVNVGTSGLTITGPLCGPCADVVPQLADRAIHCGINGCKRKWTWTALEQLQTFLAGKPDQPPRRMCEPCRTAFGKLADRDVRCRASGCKKTWTWKREEQLDACNADQPLPKPQQRLCESCFTIWNDLKDVERPCRQAGCAKTWLDRRGAQLARILRGKTGDPYPQYCEDHAQKIDLLHDREISCRTDGCSGTWTWTKGQQLAAGVEPPEPKADDDKGSSPSDKAVPVVAVGHAEGEGAPEGVAADAVAVNAGDASATHGAEASSQGRAAAADKNGAGKGGRRRKRRRDPKPPARHCASCTKFLQDRKTIEIPCKQCATPIFWPPESQLQTSLGHWAEPSMCGACKRDATEAARLAAKEILRAQGGGVVPHAPEAAPLPEAAPNEPTPADEAATRETEA